MINGQELKLLISILKGIDKHGVKTFNSLCQKISNSEINDLNKLAKLVPLRSPKTVKQKPKVNYSQLIESELQHAEVEIKSKILEAVSCLKSKSKIKNLTHLSEYLNSIGAPNKTIRTWNEGCYLFVKTFVNKDKEALDETIEDMRNNFDDRSLSRWSDVILKNNDKPVKT